MFGELWHLEYQKLPWLRYLRLENVRNCRYRRFFSSQKRRKPLRFYRRYRLFCSVLNIRRTDSVSSFSHRNGDSVSSFIKCKKSICIVVFKRKKVYRQFLTLKTEHTEPIDYADYFLRRKSNIPNSSCFVLFGLLNYGILTQRRRMMTSTAISRDCIIELMIKSDAVSKRPSLILSQCPTKSANKISPYS